MKKSQFSEDQIATALRQIDAGAPVLEVTRKLGISEADVLRENSRLKQLVADLTLDKVILQEGLAKKT